MTSKLSARFTRAKEIYQQEGLYTLFKRTFTFLLSWLSYEKSDFYLYEYRPGGMNKADFFTRTHGISYIVIDTIQRLDELLNADFDLSLFDIVQARERLKKGAVLLLLFVNQEFAHRQWLAPNEEAKNSFNNYPYRVNFSNNECCIGDAWTNPKYRRQGLNTYIEYKREELFKERRIRRMWSLVRTDNIISQRARKKYGGGTIHAKAHYVRIGRLQFWKETPVESVSNH